MIALLAFVIVHILCWGAIGAALSPRAGLPNYVGALISILLPLLGSLVLAGMALWGGRGSAAPETDSVWRMASLVGVAGGALVVVSGFLPWVEAGLTGEVGSVEEEMMAVSAADYVIWPIMLAAVGTLIAVFTWLAARRGNREWLVGTAYFAWFPVALGASLVLSEGFIDTWIGRTNSAMAALVETDVVSVAATGNYDIGAGPYAVMMGGFIALIWAFVWSLRRPVPQLSMASAGVGTTGMLAGAGPSLGAVGAYGGYSATDSDDWSEPVASTGWEASPTPITHDDWSENDLGPDGGEESDKWW